MDKPFKTIPEQITLLKERKLIIEDEQSAMSYLLSNNYYNIINGYSKYFPRDGETYTNGTTFAEVSQLHFFDKELKQAFFSSILYAEAHIKAIFAHRFAEAFPDTPYAYLNIACYDGSKTLEAASSISNLSNIIDRQSKYRDSSISHYLRHHDHVPIWVLVNYLDFGNIRYILKLSLPSIQNKVSFDLHGFIEQHLPDAERLPPEIMNSFLAKINEVRNISAHNNRMIGFNCKSDIKYWAALHNQYDIKENSTRRDIYSVFLVLQCFLSRNEYAVLHNKILKLMKKLDKQLKSQSANVIGQKLGFPDNWLNTTPKLEQR